MSGPSFNVRSSIAFRRGLKSRAESGAKAPHSMECGDSSPLFGEGFSLHNLAVGSDRTTMTGRGGTRPSNPHNRDPHSWRDLLVRGPLSYDGQSIAVLRARQACPSDLFPEGPACQVRRSTLDHQFLVRPSIINSFSPGTTSVPLRGCWGQKIFRPYSLD
ncbi:hypothetical protein THTE_0763 [Thermogutta terrifontis]|uniref:Uncharacterized protein n=1 Tax=Thermogutta terrifontis TaxID=1331910 RepID=A0A286RBP4_9BACT|nr:hypothetical protein THTE_0763 [Thermogutta terrifontis]